MRQPAFALYALGWNDAAMGRARRAHQPVEYYEGYDAAVAENAARPALH